MSIVDLTSMAEPEGEARARIDAMLQSIDENIPNYCYQCGKCTSGCEAFILLELEPHKIMALAKSGFIDELVNSDIIWTCMTCMKCKERCPQDVAPVQVIYTLKNIAVASGKQIHTGYSNMLQSVLGSGFIQQPKTVLTRANESRSREQLGLPEIKGPGNMAKFQELVMKAATSQLR